uniref:CHZ domain-containing protein n=1 Tax=Syphacia muris TaxID=451379 RepID=A0A0N5AMG5_9BILA
MSVSSSSDDDENLLSVKSNMARKRNADLKSKGERIKRTRLESSSESSNSSSQDHSSAATLKSKGALRDESIKDDVGSTKTINGKKKKIADSKVEFKKSLENKTLKEKELQSRATLETTESETDSDLNEGTLETKKTTKSHDEEPSLKHVNNEAENCEVDNSAKSDKKNELKSDNTKNTVSSSSDSEGTLAALRADMSKSPKKKNKSSDGSTTVGPKCSNSNVVQNSDSDDSLADDKLTNKSPEGSKSNDSTKDKKRNGEESSRFKRLRRLIAVAGLRFRYKQLEGVKSDSKKCRILKEFMSEHGITKFTLKDCKEFRIKKEEEAELAELKNNKIYGADSTRRVTRGSRRQEESAKSIGRKTHLSTSSSGNSSEREEMIEENRQIFGRLKGIVSDESD